MVRCSNIIVAVFVVWTRQFSTFAKLAHPLYLHVTYSKLNMNIEKRQFTRNF